MAEENVEKAAGEAAEGAPPGGADTGGAEPGGAETPASEAARLRARVEELEKKVRDTHDRLLRTAADFENFRKRSARERDQYVARAGEDIAREVLPALDNFERALKARGETTDAAALMSGVEMIYKQLLDGLARRGVEPFDSVGTRFDPAIHEALQQVHSPDHAPGTVVSEFARGFKMGGKVLRPAIVIVADAASGAIPPGASGGEASSEGGASAGGGPTNGAQGSPWDGGDGAGGD